MVSCNKSLCCFCFVHPLTNLTIHTRCHGTAAGLLALGPRPGGHRPQGAAFAQGHGLQGAVADLKVHRLPLGFEVLMVNFKSPGWNPGMTGKNILFTWCYMMCWCNVRSNLMDLLSDLSGSANICQTTLQKSTVNSALSMYLTKHWFTKLGLIRCGSKKNLKGFHDFDRWPLDWHAHRCIAYHSFQWWPGIVPFCHQILIQFVVAGILVPEVQPKSQSRTICTQ